MTKRLPLVLLTLALLAAACGGDDGGSSSSDNNNTTSSSAGGVVETTAAPLPGELACEDLITVDEAAELFGEPAMLDIEASSGLTAGTGSCVFSSIEDPEDLEDLTSYLLQVQVYQSASYFAPEMIDPDAEHIEGIGNDAYVSEQLGVSTAFVDGDLVAFVTYSIIDLSGTGPDSWAQKDQVVDLLRLVHDRLT